MVTTLQPPTRDELVDRATKLVPLLRDHAQWNDENRRLHEETIEALAGAGVFKMRIPARYGGYECDTRTVVDVAAELGRGDGAVGWIASVWWIPGWMVGMFPDAVQDEVYTTENVRVCGTLSPTAMAAKAPGGYVVNGQWGFISGALHSHWQIAIAVTPNASGEMEPIVALIPMADLGIVDDWNTTGLRGSGSVTTVAEDVFVPAERTLPLMALLTNQSASVLNADIDMYRAPLAALASACSVGNVVGMARAAWDCFTDRMPGRKITYTDYTDQREATMTHLQVAEAKVAIDEAAFHAYRVADLVDAKVADHSEWSTEDRALARIAMGATCKRALEAVDTLYVGSGGSAIFSSVPIQRTWRDLHALTQHALNTPHILYEIYGRVLCGLAPNTQFF
ncbi:acyl-CoA dehydrogenase family protein [Amycolatopsis sp. NPDC048633]|jgi:alkylation response protein AidB-like acyl-CoA dehydrogenase|uniref:acyl-CoA dehydrogenase family protein n=1 Tax=Amycolatopsis sp. NPDC048633 TaxID=3157095 RepID=UPI0033FDB6E4